MDTTADMTMTADELRAEMLRLETMVVGQHAQWNLDSTVLPWTFREIRFWMGRGDLAYAELLLYNAAAIVGIYYPHLEAAALHTESWL